MFQVFKKKPTSLMDAFVNIAYGPNPPKKTADTDQAARLAHEVLLQKRVNLFEVSTLASRLNAGEIPYSTCDLATSTALNFFRRPELHAVLSEAQLIARMQVLEWIEQKKINTELARVFEDDLYVRFKPQAPTATKQDTPVSDAVEYFKAGIAIAEERALEDASVPPKYNNIIELVKALDARQSGVLKGADLKQKWLIGLLEESYKRGLSIDEFGTLLLLFHWENYVEFSTGVRPDVTKDPDNAGQGR
jgi:hypothetical protein